MKNYKFEGKLSKPVSKNHQNKLYEFEVYSYIWNFKASIAFESTPSFVGEFSLTDELVEIAMETYGFENLEGLDDFIKYDFDGLKDAISEFVNSIDSSIEVDYYSIKVY